MVFPNALSQDINFIAKFEMTIVDGGTSGKITFSADGHSTLVHDVLELEAPTPHGKFCVLHYPQGDVRYFLQLKDEKETIKFSGCLQGLQRSIREYRQNSTAQPTEITTESLIETSKEATTDLIDADLLQRWTGETFDHMWNMTNKMAAKLGTKGWKDDHHIANEIDGALTQKWIEHGLSRDKSDGCRGALLDVLRSLVTLKLNSTNVATSTTQQHVPDSMRMMMEPIRYTMKDLKRLRPCATKCPGEIQGADFLPMSGNIISARSRIRCQGEEPQSPKSVSIPRTNNVSSGHPSNNDLSALEGTYQWKYI
jgi:hypothetical protein